MHVEDLVEQLRRSQHVYGIWRPMLNAVGNHLEQRRERLAKTACDYYAQVVFNLLHYPELPSSVTSFLNGTDEEGTQLQRRILVAGALQDLRLPPDRGHILLIVQPTSPRELFTHDSYISFASTNSTAETMPTDPRQAGIAVHLNSSSRFMHSRNPFIDPSLSDDLTAVMVSTVLAQSHLVQLERLNMGPTLTRLDFWRRQQNYHGEIQLQFHEQLAETTPYAPPNTA